MCVHAYTVHACMATVARSLASSLLFSLSYNVTALVTMFFPYKVWAAHQGVKYEIMKEVESRSLIL